MSITNDKRVSLQARMVGTPIPRLWCPPLTHYTGTGVLDTERMAHHWRWMQPFVRTFLVPGSTGDGWEMTESEIDALLDAALDLAADLGARMLVGVLRTDVSTMVESIHRTVQKLQARTGLRDALDALRESRVCGFTVCPPRGAGLSQAELREGLDTVLKLGVPVAIYQLPQITQNEMSAQLIAELADTHSNFILFKDSSGTDHVATQDRGACGVFLVRGAEGDYASWLRETGGPYHGLLLSTANCLAAPLHRMLELLEAGELQAAQAISDQLTGSVRAVFERVQSLPWGNAFTNANKAMDHFMAYGPSAASVEPPMLYARQRLPKHIIEETEGILRQAKLLPDHGYLVA